MAMDAETWQRVLEWATQHWQAPVVCPVCKNSQWQYGADLAVLQPWDFPNYGSYPVLPIICKTCGYTLLINAILAGIVEP